MLFYISFYSISRRSSPWLIKIINDLIFSLSYMMPVLCLLRRMVFLLLLTLTLGVADAGNLLEGFQQQERLPPADGLLDEVQQQEQLPPANGLLCPDQASKCRNSATCCQLSSGQWGCCPFAQVSLSSFIRSFRPFL